MLRWSEVLNNPNTALASSHIGSLELTSHWGLSTFTLAALGSADHFPSAWLQLAATPFTPSRGQEVTLEGCYLYNSKYCFKLPLPTEAWQKEVFKGPAANIILASVKSYNEKKAEEKAPSIRWQVKHSAGGDLNANYPPSALSNILGYRQTFPHSTFVSLSFLLC